MSATERIVFVPFMWKQRGKVKVLEPGAPVACRTQEDALRWVDKIRIGRLTAAGGQAVKMTVDENAGEYGEPVFLDSTGDVPAQNDA